MECPRCHCWHEAGIYRCEQCGAELLRDAPSAADPEYVPVRKLREHGALALARSLLESAQIPCLVFGEDNLALPLTGATRSGMSKLLRGATLCVPEDRAGEARALLDEELGPDGDRE